MGLAGNSGNTLRCLSSQLVSWLQKQAQLSASPFPFGNLEIYKMEMRCQSSQLAAVWKTISLCFQQNGTENTDLRGKRKFIIVFERSCLFIMTSWLSLFCGTISHTVRSRGESGGGETAVWIKSESFLSPVEAAFYPPVFPPPPLHRLLLSLFVCFYTVLELLNYFR